MELVPMTDADFIFWRERAVANYIADKMRVENCSLAVAKEIGEGAFNTLLPGGLATGGGCHLVKLVAGTGDPKALGFVWFVIRGEGGKEAFLYDLIIEDAERGRGYGKAAMRLFEERARALGAERTRLHVFGFNERAIKLYRSLDYTVADLIMEKNL